MNHSKRIACLPCNEPRPTHVTFNGDNIEIPKDEFPYIKLALLCYVKEQK